MSSEKQDDNDLTGTAGNDRLNGGLGNDVLIGGAGNDYLDGGPGGIDTAIYSGNFGDYKISYSAGPTSSQGYVITVVDTRPGSPDGTDTLRRIEIIKFADGELRDGQFYPSGPSAQVTAITALGADTGASHTDFITSQAAQTVTGTFSGSLRAGDVIQVSANGGTTWVNATISGNTWSAAGVTLAPGSGSLLTRTVDNTGHVLAGATHAYVLDTAAAAPSLVATFVDSGASAKDNITSATKATLSGTAEAGATVKVYDGAALIATVTANSSGAWSYNATGLANGTHSFTATQSDIAGNLSAPSAADTMTVDTVVAAPNLLVTYLDTGASAADHITSATMATLSGTAEAGATVKVYDGSKLIATVTADATGAWNYNASNLANGTHNFTATQTDLAGNSSTASPASSMTVDTVAPTVVPTLSVTFNDTGASHTDHLTSATAATLSGTAEKGALVQVYDGSTLLATVTASAKTGAWSYAATDLADGKHSFSANEVDIAGNAGPSSAASSMTVDTVAAVALSAPIMADNSINAVEKTNVTIAGTSAGMEAGRSLLVSISDSANHAVAATTTMGANGTWSVNHLNLGGLSDGTLTVTASGTDLAGNAASASTMLIKDTSVAAPGLTVALQDSGLSATDRTTYATKATLSGTAEAGATVQVYDNGTTNLIGTATADAINGAWRYSATGLGNGTHSFTAAQTDLAGNVSAPSAASPANTMLVDTIAPDAPLVLVHPSGVTNANHATLSGTSEPGAAIVVYDGNTPVATLIANSGGAWTYNATGLAEGVHSFSAAQMDIAGNVSARSAVDTMTVETVAPVPVVTLAHDTGSSASDHITSDSTLTLSGIETGAKVQYSTDGGNTWNLVFVPSEGLNSVQVRQIDQLGNTSAASTPLSFTFDNIAPVTPGMGLLRDTGATAGDGNTSNSALQGTAEAGATVQVFEGTNLLGTTTADGTGAWTFTPSLSDGRHSLSVTATDVAGNTSTPASISFTLDTVAPAPLGLALADDSGSSATDHITKVGTLALSGQESGAAVQYSTDGGATWTANFTPVEGLNDVEVRQTDAAGNVSAATTLAFTLDTRIAVPNVTGVSDEAGTVIGYGKADAGSLVTAYDATSPAALGTAIADGGGNWSIAFASGSKPSSFYVAAVDLAGNASNSALFDMPATVEEIVPPQLTADVTAASYADTPGPDVGTFAPVTGHLSLTTPDTNVGGTPSYGVSGGIAAAPISGYNVAEAGQYGTVYVNSSSGIYTYVPDAEAINALPGGVTAHDNFTLTFSDGVGGTAGQPLAISLTGANEMPVLGAPATPATYVDSAAGDVFNAVTGHLTATDPDTGAILSYGVSGGGTTTQISGYDLAEAGSYGTLYLNSGTGAYTYVPDNAAINALHAGQSASDSFALAVSAHTVTDPNTILTSSTRTLTINATGVNDAPMLAPLTPLTFVDTAASNVFGVVSSQLDASVADVGTALNYGVLDGTGKATTTLAGTYGTLYVDSSTGAYLYAPNDAAINALAAGQNHSDNFMLTVQNGTDGPSASQPLDINVTGALDASVIAGVDPFNYTVGSPAALVAPHLTLSNVDTGTAMATSATVAIGAGYSNGNDLLGVIATLSLPNLPTGITATFGNNGVLTITGSGTLSQYQSILESVAFQTTTAGGRTIAFTVFDGAVHSATLSTSSLSLDDISTTGIRLPGVSAGDQSGFSVSGAGDFNGDGYADIVIGAANAGPTNVGSSYVVYGGPSGLGDVLPLSRLIGSNGFSISGQNDNDRVGFSVSGAGDVNGDGLSDIIIGAPYSSNYAGGAYVVFGHAKDTVANMNVSALYDSKGFQVVGAAPGDFAGYAVSSAGDVNGDGFADVILGAPQANTANGQTGAAYVVFGHALSTPFGTVDPGTGLSDGNGVVKLAHLAPTQGFELIGAAAGDWTGAKVAAAGDINGDGIGDLIIGTATPGGNQPSATAFVVFGTTSGFGTVDLSTLDGTNGFRLIGAGTGQPIAATAGKQHYSVHAAGDVNGDGFGDIIIGAPYAATSNEQSGAAYVVFGHAGVFGTVDPLTLTSDGTVNLATLSHGQGFEIIGAVTGDRAGYSISAAGDVNGDGFGDLIIGAPSAKDNGGNPAGTSYVIFGDGSGTFGTSTSMTVYDSTAQAYVTVSTDVVNLATLGGNDGFSISAVGPGNDSGYAVGSAGDVNGDGFADLLVASSAATPAPSATILPSPESGSGESYIIFGSKFIATSHTFVGVGGPGSAYTLQGTTADETFIGGQGNATMIGGGGNDSFTGGAGNDTIHLGLAGNSSSAFLKIDGGGGTNALVLDGSGMTLDLTNASIAGRVQNIEHINLGSGSNSLVLNIHDVLNMSGTSNKLFVTGQAGDSVTSTGQGWTDTHTSVTGADGHTYASYAQGAANLLIDTTLLAANNAGHVALT